MDQVARQGDSNRQQHFRVLSNTANCYANSLTQALAAVSLRRYDLGSFQKTLEIVSRSTDSRPLSLFGLFEFRHLLTDWRLDGRQHDVTEFLSHLQKNPVGSAQPVQWQGRADGVVQDSDLGLSPLLLPLSQDPLSVSSCLSYLFGKHRSSPVHFVGRRSFFYLLSSADGKTAPSTLAPGVSHFGDSLHKGHYRAFWPETPTNPAQVWICDDYKKPEKASPAMLAAVDSTVYLLFMERIH